MTFNVSNKAFEEAFGSKLTNSKNKPGPKESQEIVQEFLKDLQAYLKTQFNNPSAIAMHDWLKRGGKISSFTCRADVIENLEKGLKENNIPYILVQESKGDFGFLIRNKDKEKEKVIAREALKSAGNYCRVMTGKEAGEEYLQSKEKDKTMVAITNLSLEEITCLEDLCNTALPGEVIGIDKMEDGTFTLSCHGPTAIDWRRNNLFPLALSSAVVKMNGSTAKESRKETKLNIEYREAKIQGFPDKNGENKKPVWVVGHQNKYVKRTSRGFELGHAEELGDKIILESDLKVDILDDRYTERLNSALSKITGHRCLYTLPDVIAYFKTRKPNYKNTNLEAEMALLNEVNKVVGSKIKLDSISSKEGSWDYKLKHYQSEISKVLAGIRDGKIPRGYSKNQMIALINLQQTLQVDANKLTPSINKLVEVGVYERDAGPQKIADIEKHIEGFKKDLGIEMPTIEPGRDSQDMNLGGDR